LQSPGMSGRDGTRPFIGADTDCCLPGWRDDLRVVRVRPRQTVSARMTWRTRRSALHRRREGPSTAMLEGRPPCRPGSATADRVSAYDLADTEVRPPSHEAVVVRSGFCKLLSLLSPTPLPEKPGENLSTPAASTTCISGSTHDRQPILYHLPADFLPQKIAARLAAA